MPGDISAATWSGSSRVGTAVSRPPQPGRAAPRLGLGSLRRRLASPSPARGGVDGVAVAVEVGEGRGVVGLDLAPSVAEDDAGPGAGEARVRGADRVGWPSGHRHAAQDGGGLRRLERDRERAHLDLARLDGARLGEVGQPGPDQGLARDRRRRGSRRGRPGRRRGRSGSAATGMIGLLEPALAPASTSSALP